MNGPTSGSRQGDFSRSFFDRARHYSAVWMQQGRVQLDADWNEQNELLAHRLRTEAIDLIGPAGAPADAAGFGVTLRAALGFDGAGRCAVIGDAGAAPLAGGGDFTLETELVPGAGGGTVVSVWRGAAQGGGMERLWVLALDGALRPAVRWPAGGAGAPAEAGGAAIEGTALAAGRPVTLGVRRAGETVELLVDGEPVARGAAPPPAAGEAAAGEATLLLGADLDPNLPTAGFSGRLRAVRVWAAADPAGEAPAGEDPAGEAAGPEPAGVWRFDAGAGDAVPDLAGSGTPAILGGGFEAHRPEWVVDDLEIGAGRMWVGGLLCETERPVRFTAQPDLPGAEPPPAAAGGDRDDGGAPRYLVYLDAWERGVTALEDPALREEALGGPDTTARSQVVAQVRWLALGPVEPEDDEEAAPVQGEGRARMAAAEVARRALAAHAARRRCGGRLAAWRVPRAAVPGNRLYRVEIHRGGALLGAPDDPAWPAAAVAALSAAGRLELEERPADPEAFRPGDVVEVRPADGDGRGTLALIAATGPAGRGLDLEPVDEPAGGPADEPTGGGGDDADPGGGLAGLAGRDGLAVRRIATFKWAADNASKLYAVAERAPGGAAVRLRDLGRGEPDLGAGDPVELADDRTALAGWGSQLAQVGAVHAFELEVVLDRVPPGAVGTATALHPVLRRWQAGDTEAPRAGGAFVAQSATDYDLEDGIQVRFEGGGHHTGDYWWIPARSATESVIWPADEALAPHGVDHRMCALAVITAGGGGLAIDDLRETFQPRVRGAVSRGGDTMSGPLTVRADLEVEGAARVGTLYGPLGSPAAVRRHNLAAAAVGPENLAPSVGTVPPGCSIFGDTPEPPPGYVHTGATLTLFHEGASWSDRLGVPGESPGPLTTVALDGLLYTLHDTGELWVFDPGSGAWRRCADLPHTARRFAAAAAGERLLVVGGVDSGGQLSGAVYAYDPAADRWERRRDLPTPRARLAAAEAGGRLYALGGEVGGWLGTAVTGACEVYEPEGDRWTRLRPMPRPRAGLAAAGVAGRVHAVGGEVRLLFGRWLRAITGLHEVYDPATDRWWGRAAPPPTRRRDLGLAGLGGRLFAVGGEAPFGPTGAVEEYDPAADRWLARTPLHEPIVRPGTAAVGGDLYAVGAVRPGAEPEVLVEQATVASRLFVHRRLPDRLAEEEDRR